MTTAADNWGKRERTNDTELLEATIYFFSSG